MKLLSEFESEEFAEKTSEDFRNKGILTYISSADSKRLGSFKTGALKVGLWVVIDEQYEDALLLLRDPSHQVKVHLSSEEMQLLEDRVNSANKKYLDSFVNKALFIAVILGSILFIIFVSNQAR